MGKPPWVSGSFVVSKSLDTATRHLAVKPGVHPCASVARTETYRRSLQRKMGSVSFDWANPKPEYFDQLIEWKSAQYSNVSGWGPQAMSVRRELAFTDNDDCRGLIGVLFAGEQTAAVTFCLEGPGVIALWTLAYNPEFSPILGWHDAASGSYQGRRDT